MRSSHKAQTGHEFMRNRSGMFYPQRRNRLLGTVTFRGPSAHRPHAALAEPARSPFNGQKEWTIEPFQVIPSVNGDRSAAQMPIQLQMMDPFPVSQSQIIQQPGGSYDMPRKCVTPSRSL